MNCPTHSVPLELTAAPVAGGWALVCPVKGCQEMRMPPRQKALPGLAQRPKPEAGELEMVTEQAAGGSKHEARLLAQIRQRGLPEPLTEFEFSPVRAWRADFAYPALKVLIECEGGLWMKGGGRHNRAAGYQNDLEKYNAASIAGWTVLRYSGDMIESGEAIAEIAMVLQWKMKGAA